MLYKTLCVNQLPLHAESNTQCLISRGGKSYTAEQWLLLSLFPDFLISLILQLGH